MELDLSMLSRNVYRASPRALLTELGDGNAVLLDLDSKFYFTLNETALFVWKRLADGQPEAPTRDDLAAALCRAFEVDEAAAGADLDALLDALAREQLVTVTRAAP